MVIGPNDVTKDNYDILIVDEAHRLKKRKNLTNFKSFDDTNKKLGLDKESTELDWIMKSSKHQIFLYDEHQQIKPTDVNSKDFLSLDAIRLNLTSQLRVSAGDDYIDFIHQFLDSKTLDKSPEFSNYDFQLFDNIKDFIESIQDKDSEYGLSRIVAGYSWKWATKK